MSRQFRSLADMGRRSALHQFSDSLCIGVVSKVNLRRLDMRVVLCHFVVKAKRTRVGALELWL